jgi:hypothetical protein
MSDNQGSFQERNDDLDLSKLFRRALLFFKTYGRMILIASLTGLLCGFILHKSMPKYYTARLLFESNVLNNTEQSELIDSWDLLLGARNYGYLQKRMNCSAETISAIRGVQVEALAGLVDQTTNCFVLNVTLWKVDQAQNIQEALLNGMQNNEFVQQKIKTRKANLNNQIRVADGEITKLDSTKTLVESLAADEKKSDGRLILDVSGISKEKVEIGEKLALYREKEGLVGVQLVQGITTPEGPKPGWLALLAGGLVAGFLFGYAAAVLKSFLGIIKQTK